MTRKHSSLPRNDEPSVSLSALKRVSDRLHRRFEDENVLPLPTVQYFLSETGPTLARIEPRELRAALEVLADNPAPAKDLPHGPWEPRPAIYVVPSFTKTNSKANAAIAAATKEEQLQAFREARPGNRALQLAIEIAKSLPVGTTLEELDLDKTEPLAGEVEWTAAGARVSVPAKGRHRAASIWITSNLTWIFPDDPALWRHLLHALASGAWPILLARKIAFSTFPLLKRLGALGLQLHHLFVPDGVPNEAPACSALASGPPILPPSVASAHCAIEEHLTAALLDGGDEVPEAADAIRLAARLGLDSEASNRLEALRAWTQSTVIQMPPPWKAQLTRYERWSSLVLQKGASNRG